MKAAFFADIHARGKDLAAFRRQWQASLDKALELGAEFIGIAGDVYDRANIVDRYASTGAIIQAVVEPLSNIKIPIIVVRGDHDIAGAGSVDALTSLDQMDNVFVLDSPTRYGVQRHDGSYVLFHCMPWQWDTTETAATEWLLESAKQIPTYSRETKHIVLGHCIVRGESFPAHYGGEGTAKKWIVEEHALRSGQFDFVALGDWHAHSFFLGDKGGYMGALRQVNYGEAGNPQGFVLWDSVLGPKHIEIAAAKAHVVVSATEDVIYSESFLETIAAADARTRIVFEERAPTNEELEACAANGIDVVVQIQASERVTRVAELPEGLSGDLRKMLEVWAAAQQPPICGEQLEELQVELEDFMSEKASA